MRSLPALLILMTTCAGAHAQASFEEIDARLASAVAEADAASARRDRTTAEIEGLVAQRAAAQRRLRSRVSALYRLRRAGLLPLAGGFEALLRHQSRVERLERMVARDVAGLRSLRARVSALQEENARLAGEVERAEQRVAALREQRAALERATYGVLAALGSPPMSADPFGSALGLHVHDAPAAGFAAMRGQLPLPVGGSATVADAQREGGAGLELSASIGVSVRAVAPGRVAYAAPHPAYGQLVILDHGDGYYTIYGGLALVSAQVGQSVPASAALGTVGAAPLFFQVRRGTRPLSAREWLGI